MRAILVILIAIVVFSCKETQVNSVSMKEDVAILANDSLNGRKTGSDGERKAANYIAKRFEDLGLQPKGSEGFFQKFTYKASKNPHQEAEFTAENNDSTETGQNVIAYLDNKAENTVVIGAHYDHLGMGGEGSLYREGEAIHNGADDNASGVAMMLHLADSLQKKGSPKNNNYLFIAFSGEEEGLLGSNYFVKNPTIDTKKVTYMLNMDMVGRLNSENTLAVYGVGTSPIFKQAVNANARELKIAENESGVGPSDHTSFYLADIPVLHFFTGQHEDYHKPSDDAEKVNFEGMKIVSNYIFSIIKDLDNQPKLPFKKTKNESEVVPEFKVTLGVVPDYLFSGKGMRIDGVSEDKPAQKAGLQKGDIVVKMGDFEVTDMMSYMKSLSKFEKGQTAKITIERGGELKEISVTF
ncbi:M20/M25/M40 family metallo-hydrolase [Aequorivita vladivostokensis]|uniref:Peptidase M28 n=1 Tax=Aequorivita vladivostokensis TaxID=171194 RepID=A0ABR5DM23_9FLAO|nr:M20/M25/M40 family metallo-hydrolase [Aequorivita vladivostokensis]KJJ39836.1 peptidase M28 [Aequorivita vladivostokensis]MAB57000.1 peptidase M28 [Aequorivita sp.]MBF32273.1 peptidase M28 [Aequorivita sp.]|tara:strand:- start:30213 stop:31442 length:1230 start_codon:yes stop_codon:yes gene_type:complete